MTACRAFDLSTMEDLLSMLLGKRMSKNVNAYSV